LRPSNDENRIERRSVAIESVATMDTSRPLVNFLRQLFDSGRVQVAPPRQPNSTQDLSAADHVLRDQVAVLRLDFSTEPPPLDDAVARWAALSFYRACQLGIFRELDEDAIDELFAAQCPASEPASRHWSVDVVFRFLPDLVRHATAASPDDPLVARLHQWCAEWPLSSVGVQLPSTLSKVSAVGEIAAHAGLLQLYSDRILAKKDWSRLAHPAVRSAIAASLGGHAATWTDLPAELTATLPPGALHESPAP
jgi:hypothetical protein